MSREMTKRLAKLFYLELVVACWLYMAVVSFWRHAEKDLRNDTAVALIDHSAHTHTDSGESAMPAGTTGQPRPLSLTQARQGSG